MKLFTNTPPIQITLPPLLTINIRWVIPENFKYPISFYIHNMRNYDVNNVHYKNCDYAADSKIHFLPNAF